jgi:hypothetical protein
VTLYTASPSPITTGGFEWYNQITVTGTNLGSVSSYKLVGGTTIPSEAINSGGGQASVFFRIPEGTTGSYTLKAYDSSGNIIGTLPDPITIKIS